MNLNPNVWGPHYWFFLHTISLHYPLHPNDFIKKKYFDFIHNLPLFIPIENMSKEFESLLNTYPLSPYLENRDSFIRWVHFIHNKINEKLEKPKISLEDFYIQYYNNYKNFDQQNKVWVKIKQKILYILLLLLLLFIIWKNLN
jgi:hypothetical protein